MSGWFLAMAARALQPTSWTEAELPCTRNACAGRGGFQTLACSPEQKLRERAACRLRPKVRKSPCLQHRLDGAGSGAHHLVGLALRQIAQRSAPHHLRRAACGCRGECDGLDRLKGLQP